MIKQTLPVTWCLTKKSCSIGSWLTIPSMAVVEIMAAAGFEWFVIDMEHSVLTADQAEQMTRCVHLYGLPIIVRVGRNEPLLIRQAMDNGASGVMVPLINTRHDAQRAVNEVFYPPEGVRGVGLARAQGYGRNFEKYRRWVNGNASIIVQIEHIEAVENIAEISSVEGVSGLIVGPYDLSASLGLPGQFSHPKVLRALKDIGRVVKRIRKPFGFHVVQPRVKEVLQRIDEGYSFIAFGVDFTFLADICDGCLKELKGIQKGRRSLK